ncbi:MAG: repressor LexA [Anaerolineae bacterium]|nr:transcriptional repressor LexA [Anaerolineales bacterium]MCQ3973621.1 repressor LexA [Anaerolineae bacterium]
MSLSERQSKILSFLKTFTLDNGYPPTIREIGEAVGISSTSVVNYNLDALQRGGFIYRDRTVSRGIRLVESLNEMSSSALDLVRVPLLGRIAAGEPLRVFPDSFDSETDAIELTRDMIPDEEGIYALKVKGTSMIDALINDGDIVVMRHTQTANNGDMVAAWLSDREETTLKRFFHEGDRIRLQPENQTMAPIYVDADKVDIKGRVVAVIRQLN